MATKTKLLMPWEISQMSVEPTAEDLFIAELAKATGKTPVMPKIPAPTPAPQPKAPAKKPAPKVITSEAVQAAPEPDFQIQSAPVPGVPGTAVVTVPVTTSDRDSKSSEQETTYRKIRMSPAEMLAEITAAKQSGPIAQLATDREALAALLRAQSENSVPQVDISPLVALVDQLTGSRLHASYKKPLSAEELGKQDLARAGMLNKADQDIADAIREFIKMGDGGYAMDKFVKDDMEKDRTEDKPFLARPPGTGGRGSKFDPLKEMKALGKRLENFQGLVGAFETVANDFKMATGAEIGSWNGQNVPGIGSTGFLPGGALTRGAAKIAGENPDHAAKMKQIWQNLQNQIVYATTGKQINESEAKRLSTALGAGAWSTDPDMVNGLRNFQSELSRVMSEREAPWKVLHPEIPQMYKQGGGMTGDKLQEMGKAKAPGNRPAALNKPVEQWTPEDEKAVEAYVKGGGK